MGQRLHVAAIFQPGTSVVAPNDQDFRFENYLALLRRELGAAAVALNLFEQAQDTWAARPTERPGEAEAAALFQKTLDLECPRDGAQLMAARLRADILGKREAWDRGEFPRDYQFELPRLLGRGFVFALDNLSNLLKKLAKEPEAPGQVSALSQRLLSAIPGLKGVRDSYHHPEDRGLGENRKGKPIATEAITEGPIIAGAGNLIVDTVGTDYVATTTESGAYVGIKISSATLEEARQVVQATFESFVWEGLPVHHPA